MLKAKKSSSKKVIKRAGAGKASGGGNQDKLRAAMKQAKDLKKSFTQALKAKTAEFKQKIRDAETNAMSKAHAALESELGKRESARKKHMAAAELKFEKSFSKKAKLGKGAKSAAKKTATPKPMKKAKKVVRRGANKAAAIEQSA